MLSNTLRFEPEMHLKKINTEIDYVREVKSRSLNYYIKANRTPLTSPSNKTVDINPG